MAIFRQSLAVVLALSLVISHNKHLRNLVPNDPRREENFGVVKEFPPSSGDPLVTPLDKYDGSESLLENVLGGTENFR